MDSTSHWSGSDGRVHAGGSLDDARSEPLGVLDEAVRERHSCRVASPSGAWIEASLCRREGSAVVCCAAGHTFRVGEELRLWLDDASDGGHFEGSVLRVGVPVPDRSPDGLLIGFLQPYAHEPLEPSEGPVLRAVFGGGNTTDLLAAPVRVVRLDASTVMFQVPSGFTVIFPEAGVLLLELGASSGAILRVRGRVSQATRSAGHLLYRVDLDEVEQGELHRRALSALRAALAL